MTETQQDPWVISRRAVVCELNAEELRGLVFVLIDITMMLSGIPSNIATDAETERAKDTVYRMTTRAERNYNERN